MGLDQKGTPVFCVKPGQAGQWNVLEEGFEKPLATFQGREDAMKYAQDIADTKEGSQVKAYDEDGNEQRGTQSKSKRAGASGRGAGGGDL
jgi:hypothetical protein